MFLICLFHNCTFWTKLVCSESVQLEGGFQFAREGHLVPKKAAYNIRNIDSTNWIRHDRNSQVIRGINCPVYKILVTVFVSVSLETETFLQ